MKILMLTPYLPFPLLSGGQIRSFNLLKNLANKHQITLVSLIKNDGEKKYIENIATFCHKVIVARRPERPWTIANIIKTGFGKYPFLVVRNYSSEAKSAVIEELFREKFDLIHAETFYVMPHIPSTRVPILLVEQTIEHLVYQHFVDTLSWMFLRPVLRLDVSKIRYWEEYYWQRATRVVAMSEADRNVMQSRIANLHVSIVPNGVDNQFFAFQKKIPQKNAKILFVGNFKWLQNREAVSVLVDKIWPLVKDKLPLSTLWIIGKFPTPEILSLKGQRIEISDTIDDIRLAYEKSQLLLAPIYGPGGTRYKILEAMATGLPVVTTPQGIEGLEIVDGKEALVRTDAKGMADAVTHVLTNTGLYQKLAREANALVRRTYNWGSIAQSLDSVYEEVAHEKS